jgi:NO-binding membrane sensor protein with MHYT domain
VTNYLSLRALDVRAALEMDWQMVATSAGVSIVCAMAAFWIMYRLLTVSVTRKMCVA